MKKRWFLGVALGAAAIVFLGLLFWPKEEQMAMPEMIDQIEKPAGLLTGMVIAVDAGHGGYDGGARSASGGWEKEINLEMALQLQSALEERGALVIMIRSSDKAFADRKRPDLDARLDMAREGKADFLISVHMNEYHDGRESGPQVFYRKSSAESRLLAGCIQDVLLTQLNPPRKRQALAEDYYMLSLPIPSVLVECGFISNPEEEKLLRDENYQRQLAAAVADGIEEYVSLQAKREAQ